ncbi:hypothetical protein MOTC310_32415 [Methylobacterium oryzae]|uniref:Uncharacterized protein n=1 Tax=Methylobacterium oryzae TaxID=334852 RepID=A0ABU7TY43_9HYPH
MLEFASPLVSRTVCTFAIQQPQRPAHCILDRAVFPILRRGIYETLKGVVQMLMRRRSHPVSTLAILHYGRNDRSL